MEWPLLADPPVARAGFVPSGIVENLDLGDQELLLFKALHKDEPQHPLAQ
ncbi:MAG: hypothetical protein LBE58_14525 [Comamonas sp.]|jgi:hypothetical protein|nr:hypothetical protein [Comamonas sp.]